MKKKLIKITFLMLLYSCMAKALSFFVRIYLARSLPLESMNYYSLASPTLLLLITLAQMGIPNAMSKLIASKKAEQSTLCASLIFSFVNNLLLFLVMVLLIPLPSAHESACGASRQLSASPLWIISSNTASEPQKSYWKLRIFP